MKSKAHVKSEDLTIEDISNFLHDLENINSFFILERGNCSYLQCINYNDSILIEERIYKDDGFKHYILGHEDIEDNEDNENITNELAIDDKYFKRYYNELFSIEEAIDIFTDYYTKIPFKNIIRRNITHEFRDLEKGFIFIKWLDSAVDNFKESLEEFVEIIEPFIIDELKKDCIGYKIHFDSEEISILENEDKSNDNYSESDDNIIKCSAFKVIDIRWAVQSIIEIASKYEFLEDILLFKKDKIEENNFFKLNIDDFRE
ncbi:hypothetical protein KQY27_01300 [Methanobrevibacter sp. TMH8]|uniref:hypothetical protein n=1 Tax=Methanobrevibacter sp. TMH8 TaxID=2848611 RepID=UPI001CCBD6E1|nr:hypothetical protein [Methanobrevibacter sp. TMH8]MBZ9570184.1 hypothetical protein [Methanobrevibacter sp. TMH8]